jgi:hypothetical protein
MSTAGSWFLVIMGREQGPFSSDDMRKLVADGSIKTDSLVRRGDQPKAVAAARIRGLLPVGPAPTNSGPHPGTAIQATRSATVPTTRRAGAAAKTATPPPALESDAAESASSASADRNDDELSGAQVPEGRATSAQRLRSLGIDVLLIGGLAFGLILYAWGMADRASGQRISAIDAARKSQSEAHVSNRGEPRPSLAGWPAVETQVKERIAAKRLLVDAANAALPNIPKGTAPTDDQALQQAAAANLANELDFLVKYLDFETTAYAKETAQIATIREATTRSANFLIGFGMVLLVVIAPICELLTGGTPGKLLTGLRAVGSGRTSIGVGSCLIRHAARFVPGAHVPLFTAQDGLALHDRWSLSEVVEKSAVQRGGRQAAPARAQGKARSSSSRAGSQTRRASYSP